ncbi:MAG: hypothetical protein PHQ34_13110 [Methanothrix sp.]|jgi:hypothetical protein|nr:hypothetical protein [Methanothrix sp.]
MVVGRTLWDFAIEALATPGVAIVLIALLLLFEITLILMLLLAHNGILDLKFSYGGMGLELGQFAALLA